MPTSVISWNDTIDEPWLKLAPIHVGEVPSGCGTPEKYILFSQHDQPILRIDAYRSSEESYPFNDAIRWNDFLVVGWGDCAYLIEIDSGAIVKHKLGIYFGHLYPLPEYLLIASGERLWCINRRGSIEWMSDLLGIDGIVVHDVTHGVISGEGEWDPPGGWQPFAIMLDSGHRAK
jgi:hypothetical protein